MLKRIREIFQNIFVEQRKQDYLYDVILAKKELIRSHPIVLDLMKIPEVRKYMSENGLFFDYTILNRMERELGLPETPEE